MLTDTRCRTAKPQEKPYKLADSKGLHLYVTPSGYKSWRWKYRFAKKEKLLTIGPYPEISAAKAREKRDEAARLLREGVDPSMHRRQRAAELATEAANTFETIARRWHETNKAKWTPQHAEQVLDSLVDNVFPELGRDPITSITAPMVLKVIQAIEARPAIETARRVRQRMSAVFVFAIASGVASQDPASVIRGALKPLKKGRQPAFTRLEDARALLNAAEDAPAYPVTKLASRFLALTAVRPGVLRWIEPQELEDLDGKEPLWRIPAAKMKLQLDRKGDETYDFLVPLSRQAVEVIKTARSLTGNTPLIFPSNRHAHRPMSENAIGYMYNRLSSFRGRHVPHGWRATFSTVMNERAVEKGLPGDRAIIDLMLAHIPAGVEGIYNRAAYLPRRRALAQEWADLLLDGLPPASQLLQGTRK